MNNKPLSATILINRLQKKYNISDYKLAGHVESFWTRTKWPEYYIQYEGMRTQEEIIKKGLPKVLASWLDYSAREKGLRALKRDLRKLHLKIERDLKLIKKGRDPQRKKIEIIHKNIKIINEWKQSLIKDGYSNRAINKYIKERFGFYEIPKWLDQSDKTLERNVDKIIAEIESAIGVQIERDYLRSHPELLPELCLDKNCKQHHNGDSYRRRELRRLQNTVYKPGTNKWLDEQKFKKYVHAQRAKNERTNEEFEK